MWVGSLGWEHSLEKVTGNPLQYSCLQNPMDRGAWQTTVHGVAKSQTSLKRLSMHICTPGKPTDIYWMIFLCSKYNHLKLSIFINERHVVKMLYCKSLQKAFKPLSLPTFRITNEGECESPWISPGQNTGMSSLFLFQGTSQLRDGTQVSHIADGFFTSSATRKPKNTAVLAYPFCRRSSRPRNPTQVSCIAGGFFTN